MKKIDIAEADSRFNVRQIHEKNNFIKMFKIFGKYKSENNLVLIIKIIIIYKKLKHNELKVLTFEQSA